MSSFHQSSREAGVGFLYYDSTGWDGWDGTFSCISVTGPVRFPEVPPALLFASDHGNSETNVGYGWAVLAVREIIQDSTRGWLGVTFNRRHPAEVRRVVSLPSGGVEGASLLRVMNELEVIERRPVLQLVSI